MSTAYPQSQYVSAMPAASEKSIPTLIEAHHERLFEDWLDTQQRSGALRSGQIQKAALAE
jgi:hypothetical protein